MKHQGLLASLPGGDPAVNEAIIRGLARGWPKDKPARLDQAGEARSSGWRSS